MPNEKSMGLLADAVAKPYKPTWRERGVGLIQDALESVAVDRYRARLVQAFDLICGLGQRHAVWVILPAGEEAQTLHQA